MDSPEGASADLAGEVAVVTGGGAGVGAALCRRLAKRGATVVIVDLDVAATNELADELGAEALSFDVSDSGQWARNLDSVVGTHGGLDKIALNAGVMSRPKGIPMGGDDPLQWLRDGYEKVRSVNMDGVAYGIIAAVPHLRAGGGGQIVVTASTAGLTPQPEDPAYSMSKHGIIGLVRSLGGPLAHDGISIGALCPGGIDTSMIPPDFRDAGYEFAPPDHVAAALETILGLGLDESGGVWVTRGVNDPAWRYEFAPLRPRDPE